MNIDCVAQRRARCRVKICHLTADAAAQHAAGLTKKNQSRGRPIPGVPVVYFCSRCDAYHFGHDKETHP